jgi:hypothetical protein
MNGATGVVPRDQVERIHDNINEADDVFTIRRV